MSYSSEYYKKNKEAILANNKAWREANPEALKESQRKWREVNEGRTYETPSGYVKYIGYAHPVAAPAGITNYHRIILWDKLNGQDVPCHWCGTDLYWFPEEGQTRLVTDHVNTVRNDNRPENLVPACHNCNVSREGGHRAHPRPISSQVCSLDFCDRQAVSRFRDLDAVFCGTHYNQAYRGVELRPVRKHTRSRLITDTHKECTNCGVVKPWSDYYIRDDRPKGACKACEISRIVAARRERVGKGDPCEVADCTEAAVVKRKCTHHYNQEWQRNRKANTEKEMNK